MVTQVVIGPSSRKLAESIAAKWGVEKIYVQHKKFPDGESYIRLAKPIKKGAEVIVVQTLYPQNDSLIELLLILDVIREFQPKHITAFIPYFAYSRQWKRYRTWEAISAKTVVQLIDSKVDFVVTENPHDNEMFSFFRKAKASSWLLSTELIAKHFERKLKYPFVLAPDQEREKFTGEIARWLNCDYSWLSKHRDRKTGNITTKIRRKISVRGKDVLLVDDIISSGGTMLNAIKILKKLGARSISIAATHYIPLGAHKKLLKAGAREVVATNSIESEISKLDLAAPLGLCADWGYVP